MEMRYHAAWLKRHMEAVDYDRNALPDPIHRLASFVDVVRDTLNGGLKKTFWGDGDRMRSVAITASMLRAAGLIDAVSLLHEAQMVYRRALTEVDDLTEDEEARAEKIESKLAPILSEHADDVADAYVQDLVEEKLRAAKNGYIYKATVEFSGDPARINVSCNGGCKWKGVASELDEIGDAILTPGDPSPAGRCPICGTLAYATKCP